MSHTLHLQNREVSWVVRERRRAALPLWVPTPPVLFPSGSVEKTLYVFLSFSEKNMAVVRKTSTSRCGNMLFQRDKEAFKCYFLQLNVFFKGH